MPASLTRLRIAGFKSFADPVTVEILPGLTGIVGPNGCGKSNVVEALRWAMGETSARSLRGAEMDDVIFAGTAHRPARNLADVTLVLEDTLNLAPPPFHEAPSLEIARHIERGGGSTFRVNGREARARDVQTLFADLASGARASAMVSQGRVGALVAARPEERRAILEEAAGITGLHARRHEAELKLRATEANLARAEDLRTQLESQLESLQRQARQAARYRTISATIRGAEAELLSLQQARVTAEREAADAALHEARNAVAQATAATTHAAARAAETESRLPPLRTAEAEARTALERHRVAGERIAAEIARARADLEAAHETLARLDSDLAHATRQQEEADTALARLDAESHTLAAAAETHPAQLESAETEAAAAQDALHAADAEANRAAEHAADLAARHRALADSLAAAEPRARRLRDQLAALEAEQARLEAASIPPSRLAEARSAAETAATQAQSAAAALAAAEAARTQAHAEAATLRDTAQRDAATLRQTARATAETLRATAAAALAAARKSAAEADREAARLGAERQALAAILGVKDNERWPRMIDQLTVPAGLESALGAAIGEELDSAADETAARHWRALPPFTPAPPLPAGATPLATIVTAPATLDRALSQIGLLESDPTQAQLAALAPGQILLTREGGVWRWDGYTIRPGTRTAAALRLEQRNRLAALTQAHTQAETAATAARAALAQAEHADRTARAEADRSEHEARAEADRREHQARTDAKSREDEAAAAEREARAARDAADAALTRARTHAATLETQAQSTSARAAALADQATRLAQERTEAETTLATIHAEKSALPDAAEARAALDAARANLAAARTREKSAESALAALQSAHTARANRQSAIGPERALWTERTRDARFRLADLTARRAEAATRLATLEAAPADLQAQSRAATETLDQAERAHAQAANTLAEAEAEAHAAARASRAAEFTQAESRERAARAEGDAAQAAQAWGTIAERILERLGANPALPDPPADTSLAAEDRMRRRHERLLREREEMGPVNLRAEIEAADIEQRIETITREAAELGTAIAKLRGSIGHLNREGRERLNAVFADVDRNFQALFARMFNGGRAHLALVGSDDPLTAGLEIYAQPPGKKLASLGLLSGGEQALTALSLIFAVFLCNPAPVCVLDEVDAPLDDANVDRFCTLLEDMVRQTGTRFLVVTHHSLTMARMDRLYGVTMQERGISRVLSVDLREAEAMVVTAPAANIAAA